MSALILHKERTLRRAFFNEVCLSAREVMLRIVKLLRSEVSAEVSGTLCFTSCVSTILHSGTAAASLAAQAANFTISSYVKVKCGCAM